MKVFISWSGPKAKLLAIALRDWLPLVIQSVTPWMSEKDINAGRRWRTELADQLEECGCGIVCLTKDSLTSPWVLFESGALAKTFNESLV
jgi:TIR domain